MLFRCESLAVYMLQLFCDKLDVTDLEEVVPALQRLTVTADAYPHLEQVMSVVTSNLCSLCDINVCS